MFERTLLFAAVSMVLSSGCITTRAQHDALVDRVAELEQQQVVVQAEREQLAEERRKLREDVGETLVRVVELEETSREALGSAEQAGYVASTASQEIVEMRSDHDRRLQVLEERLQEATGIPETKEEVWLEAERQLGERDYKYARRLYRTFEVRYPDDPRQSEVAFKIGLTHYGERDYRSALTVFYKVADKFGPDADFYVDSLYYAGLCFERLGQCDNATQYYEAVLDERVKESDEQSTYKEESKRKIEALAQDDGSICRDRARQSEPEEEVDDEPES